jgi:glutamyl-tRNA reductase
MFGLIGISHKIAPIEIREKFSFTDEDIREFAEKVIQSSPISSIIVLNTCNRTEVYYRNDTLFAGNIHHELIRALFAYKGIEGRYETFFYSKKSEQAVRHLFEVASGIDSMVLGEDQILSQVKDSLQKALDNKTTSNALTRLFQKAIEAGKDVRTNTEINVGCASVSSATVELCFQRFKDFKDKTALFIGAGETGELAVNAFIKKGAKQLYITNRTKDKAEELARKYHAEAVEFKNYKSYLPKADLVVVATGAGCYLIDKEDIALSQKQRGGKYQILADLSVPRNINESVKEVENIELLDIESLQKVVDHTIDNRRKAVIQAHSIIDRHVHDYMEWASCLLLNPTIKKIKDHFETINRNEFKLFFTDLSVTDNEAADLFVKKAAEKYVRNLVKNIKHITENGKRADYIHIVNQLFTTEPS